MTADHHHQVRGRLPGEATDYAVSVQARQHAFVADEPPREGGGDTGPRPFELVLGGLIACTAITIRMYAKRKQWPLRDVAVDASLLKNADGFVITRSVHLGGGLSEEQRARIAEIAEKTPVTLLMKQGASVRTTVTADGGGAPL